MLSDVEFVILSKIIMEKPYFYSAHGSKIAGELLHSLQVLQKNNALKRLIYPLRRSARVESDQEYPDETGIINTRLARMQAILKSKDLLKLLLPLEGAVRRLEGGAAVMYFPSNSLVGTTHIRRIVKGNCDLEVLRVDVTREETFPLGLNPEVSVAKTRGYHLLAASGLVTLDIRGRIAEESLDGISLWFLENGRCFGTTVMFRGPASNTPHRTFPYNRASHTNHVAEVRKSITELSFLSTPKT